MNEVVKYHNDLNTLTLGGLTENQTNILFTIFASIKDKGTHEVHFDFNKIVELSGISTTNKKYLKTTVFSNFDKLQNLKIRYSTKEYDAQEVIFPKVKVSKDKTKLSVKVSKEFAYIFNSLMNNFTRFELAEFVALEGKYTKTLYRLLKQFRTNGFMVMKWDKFTEIMDIPKNYEMHNIEKRILKPAVKRLSSEQNLFDQRRTPFKDLKYLKIRGQGRGRPVCEIQFSFSINTLSMKQNNTYLSQFENEKFDYENNTYKIIGLTKEDNKIRTSCINTKTQEPLAVVFINIQQLQKAIINKKTQNLNERLYSN